MRLALVTSAITAAAMWLVLGGSPAESQKKNQKTAQCEYCSHDHACPHCKKAGHGAHHHSHRYEYKCVHQSERANKKAAQQMSDQFTALGQEGWRLSKADNGFWCFKRWQHDE